MDDSHFSLDNIPYGIGSKTPIEAPTVVTRVFDKVVFLDEVAKAGLISDVPFETVATFNQVKLSQTLLHKLRTHILTHHNVVHAQRPCFSRSPSTCCPQKKAASLARQHL